MSDRPSLYLVNPAEEAPGYFGAEVLEAWGVVRVASMGDLATTTVAALVPPGWDIAICDERVQPVDLDTPARFVGLTGKVSQRDRMIALAAEFRRRGKTVLIGGPYASLNPDDMRPHADVLVRGEMEDIAAEVFADLAAGRARPQYLGTKPDLGASPIPRWDLYPTGLAISAQVQTSRGCPFDCEFCDVIQYLGRKQRWKEPDQVARELDLLHGLGYRSVFFADDNLTVMRRRARQLLQALAAWNAARGDDRMVFSTQVSIDIARDAEMLGLLVEANFENVFIGIETPNAESLAGARKRQNLKLDLAAEVGRLAEAGLMPLCGLIVGFDHDGPDIFERQDAFVESLPVPLVTTGLLVAPAATPLHARVAAEKRLVDAAALGAGRLTETNIVPLLMSREQLGAGMKWLLNRVYAPAAVARRIERFAACAAPRRPAPARDFFVGGMAVLARRLAAHGADDLALLRTIDAVARRRPDLASALATIMVFYCQTRYSLAHQRLWDPALGRDAVPPLAA